MAQNLSFEITQRGGLGANRTITKTISVDGIGGVIDGQTIADSTTDGEYNMAADVSTMSYLYIESDQDITIETNDGTTPDDTLTITANNPVIWYTGCFYSNPITTNITTNIFVTNSSGSTATLYMVVGQDATV